MEIDITVDNLEKNDEGREHSSVGFDLRVAVSGEKVQVEIELLDLKIPQPRPINDYEIASSSMFSELPLGSFETEMTAEKEISDYSLISEIMDSLSEQSPEISDVTKVLESSSNKQLTVRSNEDFICTLPWADYFLEHFGHKTVQVRYLWQGDNNLVSAGRKDRNNLLVCLSNAFINPDSTEMHKIADDFKNETNSMYMDFLSNIQMPEYRPQTFSTCKFINKTSLQQIEFDRYDVLHIAMHGRDGKLGFEKENDPWILDWLDLDEFMEFLPKKHTYKLVFLSMCDSAKGNMDMQSVAARLVLNQIAEYVVGFNGTIGSENTIHEFVEHFYSHYFLDSNIEEAYRKAYDRLITINNQYWNKPIIYKYYE